MNFSHEVTAFTLTHYVDRSRLKIKSVWQRLGPA